MNLLHYVLTVSKVGDDKEIMFEFEHAVHQYFWLSVSLSVKCTLCLYTYCFISSLMPIFNVVKKELMLQKVWIEDVIWMRL